MQQFVHITFILNQIHSKQADKYKAKYVAECGAKLCKMSSYCTMVY